MESLLSEQKKISLWSKWHFLEIKFLGAYPGGHTV